MAICSTIKVSHWSDKTAFRPAARAGNPRCKGPAYPAATGVLAAELIRTAAQREIKATAVPGPAA